jgi:hypothetical protein
MAADIAATRSSSTSAGRAEAIVSPSTLTTAEASTSGDEACRSLRRATIRSVGTFDTKFLWSRTPPRAGSRAAEL